MTSFHGKLNKIVEKVFAIESGLIDGNKIFPDNNNNVNNDFWQKDCKSENVRETNGTCRPK